MPDKYDELIGSEMSAEEEWYEYDHDPLWNDKEGQVQRCWELNRKEK